MVKIGIDKKLKNSGLKKGFTPIQRINEMQKKYEELLMKTTWEQPSHIYKELAALIEVTEMPLAQDTVDRVAASFIGERNENALENLCKNIAAPTEKAVHQGLITYFTSMIPHRSTGIHWPGIKKMLKTLGTNMPEAVGDETYKHFVKNGMLEEAQEFRDKTGIAPNLEAKFVEAAYDRIIDNVDNCWDSLSIHNIKKMHSLTAMPPSRKIANRVFKLILDRENSTVNTLNDIMDVYDMTGYDTIGVSPGVSQRQADELYSTFFGVCDTKKADIDYFKKMNNVLKTAPSEQTVQEAYAAHLANQDIKRLQK